MVQMYSTQGYGASQGVKILAYSPAGHGKTTLCATAPNPVIISAESGLLTLARYNLPYIPVNSITELRAAYAWAKSSTEARHFQTVCLDSISEIAEVVLSEKKAKVKDGRMAYGEMIDDMTKVVKEFRDLSGFHVYMTSKLERVKDETTGIIINQPMMPGHKLGQAMPYFPDEVFYLGIEGTGPNSYRYLRTQPDFQYTAKDRSGMLDPIEEPHLAKIIAKITGVAA